MNSIPLQPGCYYHIFNRGNNSESIFPETRNYPYFLQLYTRHILPVADTYAYCLLKNHFHILVRIKTEEENIQYRAQQEYSDVYSSTSTKEYEPSRHFANFFNAYVKAINKTYQRTGSLFQEHFPHLLVTSDDYFVQLVFYIHFNPQKHAFIDDFRDWPWSSYPALISSGKTHLEREAVLGWFGGLARFVEFHRGKVDEKRIAALVGEDLA